VPTEKVVGQLGLVIEPPMPVAAVAAVGGVEVGTDYNQNELVEQSMEDNTQQKKLKPGDVRIVNINGRPTTLVIGREYEFRLKPGAIPTPYHPPSDSKVKKAAKAPAKVAKKSAAKKTAGKKVAAKAVKPVEPNKKKSK
jgi:hypothetical protein